MRRLLFIAAVASILFACGRERPAAPAPAQKPATAPPKTTKRAAAPPEAPKINRSTPDHCAGDGSYGDAVECFRSTSRLAFSIDEGKGVRAEGELDRPTPGAERARFTLRGSGSDDGEWSAESKTAGVIWTRRGQRTTSEPAVVDRIWQRTALYIDPQKKEGEAQKVTEEWAGDVPVIHYRFTDANSGDIHDVWVDKRDGHIMRVKVEAHGAFPSYELKIAKMGK